MLWSLCTTKVEYIACNVLYLQTIISLEIEKHLKFEIPFLDGQRSYRSQRDLGWMVESCLDPGRSSIPIFDVRTT